MNYILKNKIPVRENDYKKWLAWFDTADRRVALTKLPGGVEVSTVFLAMGDRDKLFHTAVTGGAHNGYSRYYGTWEESEAGHQETIEMIFA